MLKEATMTTVTPISGHVETRWTPQRLTSWSLLMVVVYLMWAAALGFFGSLVLMPWLDLPEGSLLLMAGGVTGWVAEIGMTVLLIAPIVVGVALAVKAVRRGGRWTAWLALGLNAVLIAQAVFSFIDAVHMTYYPQGGWLIW
jgi:phosphoglycerol transferase MdoB-like AlkP superfamily enzyme